MIYPTKDAAQAAATAANLPANDRRDGFRREAQRTAHGWTVGLASPSSQRDVLERV